MATLRDRQAPAAGFRAAQRPWTKRMASWRVATLVRNRPRTALVTVVVPGRRDHVVSFTPTAGDLPVLDVYLIEWKDDLSKDAERLIAHFTDARGGNASSRVADIAGQPGMLVTAHVNENGRDSTVLLALFKRGEELFRIRASMPVTAEAAGTTMFNEFVKSFALTAATR